MGDTYMTRAGYEKLVKELEALKVQKENLSREIGETREQGDLRENAGYQYAREKQSETLRRIAEITQRISGAKIIDDLDLPKDEVIIGTKVKLQDMSDNETYEYILVGAEEADPGLGKISVHAPVAQGILGHKVNEEVEVTLPGGKSKFRILQIEPAI
jgi:transcription elongation factor GreA